MGENLDDVLIQALHGSIAIGMVWGRLELATLQHLARIPKKFRREGGSLIGQEVIRRPVSQNDLLY